MGEAFQVVVETAIAVVVCSSLGVSNYASLPQIGLEQASTYTKKVLSENLAMFCELMSVSVVFEVDVGLLE